ncbi:uncharacterized protein AB675_10015 [Cyphellophora attinorum]|uniref:Dihydrolipoamide acetyltransferase component of pyruvate dehydrogenase complex n=1 Tax=Cyphellophora attinorum TaxID=1664694 RepID=A0A0N1H440_9EURO|nr:uncharacterized protein AB675_10015 [Phialophora attinorum]KPI36666.1 hypothetical protein AB675_10015 [Phialophora attinorum]
MKPIPSPTTLRYLRQLVRSTGSSNNGSVALPAAHPFLTAHRQHRHFHRSRPLLRTETHTLSDIGEGVKEVQIIQWFVEEGAQVEEWDALCEVQSDKAAVEITSKYSGTIKKLHFKRDAIVQVGDGMVDIEVEGEDSEDAGSTEAEQQVAEGEQAAEGSVHPEADAGAGKAEQKSEARQDSLPPDPEPAAEHPQERGKHASLATPAVRGMLKEHDLKIESINGTGKDGRVLKEDVLNYLNKKPSASASPQTTQSTTSSSAGKQTETAQSLTPIQNAMFKSMTASLSIPHFLYTDSINITALSALRTRLNATSAPETKLSYLPFIIKAISLALRHYPILNARLDTNDPKPQLQIRSQQNIGVAWTHPPAYSTKARANKLSTADLSGGTITVSNIGSIGGGEVVAPVLVPGQLAICGIGKVKDVPVFNEKGNVVKAKMVQLSWSADHRVVDGATMARAAELVKSFLEEPGRMVVELV